MKALRQVCIKRGFLLLSFMNLIFQTFVKSFVILKYKKGCLKTKTPLSINELILYFKTKIYTLARPLAFSITSLAIPAGAS